MKWTMFIIILLGISVFGSATPIIQQKRKKQKKCNAFSYNEERKDINLCVFLLFTENINTVSKCFLREKVKKKTFFCIFFSVFISVLSSLSILFPMFIFHYSLSFH